MMDGADAVQLGGTSLAPQRHLGLAGGQRRQHSPAHPWVRVEQVGRDGYRLRVRPRHHINERRIEVRGVDAQDLQRAVVFIAVSDQNRDVPARCHPVEQPATGILDGFRDSRGDDVEAVPRQGTVGASSRRNDST